MAWTMLGRTVCKSMVTLHLHSRTISGCRRRSFHDASKARVVVAGVVTGLGALRLTAAADDPPRAAVPGAGSLHGVFAVVAPRLGREDPLSVAEHAAVLAVFEGAAQMNLTVGLLRLDRDHGQRYGRRLCRWARPLGCGRARQRPRNHDGERQLPYRPPRQRQTRPN